MNSYQEYKYLWDGSEPGWVINRSTNTSISITVIFNKDQPSKEELSALLKITDSFKSVVEIYRVLKKCKKYYLGDYDSIEYPRILEKCSGYKLNYETRNNTYTSDLIFNEISNMALSVKDDYFSNEMCDYLIKKGIPLIETTD